MATEAAAIDEQQDVPTIERVSETLDNILNTLAFAGKRVSGDDVFKSALSNAENLLAILTTEINEVFNYEADQYNELADQYSNLEANHGLTLAALRQANDEQAKHEFQLAEMKDGCEQIVRDEQRRAQEAINAAEQKAAKWETAYIAQCSQVTSLKATNGTLQSELRQLRALEPEKLKKKLFDEKKKNRELSDTNRQLQNKHNAVSLDNLGLKKYCADIEARNTVLSEDMTRYREQMNLSDGDHCVQGIKFASPINEDVVFYPHLFHWSPWVAPSMPGKHDGIRFINNLDFHIQIRNTIGMETSYKVSEWGIPIGMIPKELEEHWPEGLDDFIDDFVLEQIDILNPHLAKRCRWAREIHVSELTELPSNIRSILAFHNVKTLAHLGSTYSHQLEKYKGIGTETIKTIMNMTRRMLTEWDKEHGAPDLERKRPEVKQKELDRRISNMKAENLKSLNERFNAA
ncbi:hypothetical protein [Citrobacter werkmanii]|uniref:hypothetical protein n=1 Tax=Citrobacter werkmanii TaxID=67827 RepID=UPI0037C84887